MDVIRFGPLQNFSAFASKIIMEQWSDTWKKSISYFNNCKKNERRRIQPIVWRQCRGTCNVDITDVEFSGAHNQGSVIPNCNCKQYSKACLQETIRLSIKLCFPNNWIFLKNRTVVVIKIFWGVHRWTLYLVGNSNLKSTPMMFIVNLPLWMNTWFLHYQKTQTRGIYQIFRAKLKFSIISEKWNEKIVVFPLHHQ